LLGPDTFPVEEMLPVDELVTLAQSGAATVLALRNGETYLGVAVLEECGGTTLLAYLAVAAAARSGGYGSALLAAVRAEAARRGRRFVLAEIERPGTQPGRPGHGDPARRAAFYGRHGAKALAIRHWQPAIPPYGPVALALIAIPTTAAGLPDLTAQQLREFETAYHGEPAAPELAATLADLATGTTVACRTLADLPAGDCGRVYVDYDVKATTVSAVVAFDAMGVLYSAGDDVAELLIPYVRELGCTLSDYEIRDLYHRASRGELTADALWAAYGVPGDDATYCTRFTLVPGIAGLVADLAQSGVRLACLSNDVSEWSARLRRQFGLDKDIQTWVISGDIGVRKPDGRAYAALVEAVGVPPEHIIFFDDREDNVAAARVAGLDARRFVTAAAARVALRAVGLLA
jgi:putative hydrolase of the HAD superfamily